MIKSAADVAVEACEKSKWWWKKWQTYTKQFPATHQALPGHRSITV